MQKKMLFYIQSVIDCKCLKYNDSHTSCFVLKCAVAFNISFITTSNERSRIVNDAGLSKISFITTLRFSEFDVKMVTQW